MSTPESLRLAEEVKRLATAYGTACHNAGFSFKFNETCRIEGDKRISAAWAELHEAIERLASPTPPARAPEAGAERAAFEKWALEENRAYRDEHGYGFQFYPNGSGGDTWAGWQARAALSPPPATDEQPNGSMFDALGEPRVPYERLTLDGSHMVLTQAEAEAYLANEPPETTYLRTTVYLSEREFEDLPEFDGF